MLNIINVKGTLDILPNDLYLWNFLKYKIIFIIKLYGYENIKTPSLEYKKLFSKNLGFSTDIIEKQIYTFTKNFDSKIVCLKPENTTSIFRVVLNYNFLNFKIFNRFWYSESIFRHEKPQFNRYREFYQIGIEFISNKINSNIELEIILLSFNIFKKLNLINNVILEINSIGNLISRDIYKKELILFLKKKKKFFKFNLNFLNKFYKNPLRLLDNKNIYLINLLKNCIKLINFIDLISFSKLREIKFFLKKYNISFVLNKNLVRGLDYYDNFVFEWIYLDFKKIAIIGGGSYNFFFNKKKILSGCGWAIGFNRLLEIYKKKNILLKNKLDIIIIYYNNKTFLKSILISEKLRKFGFKILLFKFTKKLNFKKNLNNLDFIYALILKKNLLKFNILKLIYLNSFLNKNIYKYTEKYFNKKNLYKFFFIYKKK